MKEKRHAQQYENPGNILYDFKLLLSELPLKFREIVAHECAWSYPTYYRKMRPSANEDKIFSNLSNAEIDMVFTVMDGIVNDFVQEYEEYKSETKKKLAEMDLQEEQG